MKKLAIIVPYRNRQAHLEAFLQQIPQKINEERAEEEKILYDIFIIEQGNDKPFNRGKLLNVGFKLSEEEHDYFCFHDVDLMPTSADYSYVEKPTHLAANVSQFRHWIGKGLAYPTCFGGVTLFNKEDFIKINGFSNQYWGYGAEDDDILLRVVTHALRWERRLGVFESLPHPLSSGTPEHQENKKKLKEALEQRQSDTSGLNDLSFSILKERQEPSWHFYSVDI